MPSWLENGSASSQDPSKQRKRWEIEDKKLLKNLRYQLAEDGSSECQFELAKQLLEDTDDLDSSRQVQGINYLKKAAEQGHEMALELLGACYRCRRGINASNENEIKTFLNLTPEQRVARHAAHELFNSLCNGNEYVTVEQLEKRMREIYKLQKKKKKPHENKMPSENGEISVHHEDELDESSSKSSSPLHVRRSHEDDDDNHISEANLLSAASNYANGIIPAVNQALTLSVPHPQSLQHVPYLHRPFFHPTMFFSLLYHRFIEMFSSFSTETFKKYQIIVLLFVYALISTKNPMVSLPTFGYYITLIIMVVSSFKMLKSKHEFIDFRIWSGLFLSYNDNVYADASENLYHRKNLRPYLWFFIAFVIHLMICPLIADQWLPNSEITVLAFSLTFVTMICFMSTSSRIPDLTILFSFALNVLAKYPYEMDSIVSSKWRFLDLKIPGFPSFVIGSSIELSMNCRGLLYIVILLFMLMLARRRNWSGIFQFLFPHCVTLAWLQLTIISSQQATTFGLMRSTLGLAGILFFLPIFGLATLLLPVFAAVEWLSVSDSTNKLFITISTSLIAIIGSCFMAISNRTGKYVTYVHILICIFASFFLFRPYMLANDGNNLYASYLQETSPKVIQSAVIDESESLNWNIFYKYCLSPATSNRIKLQMRCSHLNGASVHWDGIVNEVEITRVKNWRRELLSQYAPEFIDNFLSCYYGEINQANCFEGENCEIKEFIDRNKQCNLDKWNIYEYEIEVKISSLSSSSGLLNLNPRQETHIILKAEHAFGNFTSLINANDKIWFKGKLLTSLSEDSCRNQKIPRVKLNSIGCLHCADKSLKPVTINSKLNVENHMKDLQRGIKYLLNVLFYPLVTIK